MIGKFKDAGAAERAKEIIDELMEFISKTDESERQSDRYTDDAFELLRRVQIYSVGPSELEQFIYDVSVDLKDDQIVITTDEIEVSAFLKLMIDKGARVDVYSRHDYPDKSEEN